MSTDPSQPNGVEKPPSPWKRCALPLSHTTYDGLKFLHRSLHRVSNDERTVTTACPQPAVTNGPQRPTSLEGQTRRATHPGQENYSPPKGRIHLRRLVFSTKLFPCSRAADHTFVTVSRRRPSNNGCRVFRFSCQLKWILELDLSSHPHRAACAVLDAAVRDAAVQDAEVQEVGSIRGGHITVVAG
jgi:hypothetical protein